MLAIAAPGDGPAARVLSEWSAELSVLLGVLGLVALYVIAAQRLRPPEAEPISRWQSTAFLLAALTILLALTSPLHELSDHYLFSAHMLQHLLLTMVFPTLLLIGIPSWMLSPVLRFRLPARVLRMLTLAPVAYLLFNVAFAASHAPAFYDLTLQQHGLHTLEHVLFMGLAVLAWWPIFSPAPEAPTIPVPAQLLYLFLQTFPMFMVGAMITDADVALYPTYATAPRLWGISALDDQQMGGLIMWVGGSFYYLVVLTIVFFRWALGEEAREPGGEATVEPRSLLPGPR